MARKTEQLKLGARTYHVTQLGARAGLRTLNRTAKCVFPALRAAAPHLGQLLGELGSTAAGGGNPRQVLARVLLGASMEGGAVDGLLAAGERLTASMSDAELDALVDTLLLSGSVQVATAEGSTARLETLDAVSFDVLLAGDMAGVLRLLVFALQVNFGSFFDALPGPPAPPVAGVAPPST